MATYDKLISHVMHRKPQPTSSLLMNSGGTLALPVRHTFLNSVFLSKSHHTNDRNMILNGNSAYPTVPSALNSARSQQNTVE